jgi:hypothetical protein
MEKIILTPEQVTAIQQHLDGQVGMFTATQHQMDVLKPVINRAKELMLELDAFDEVFESIDGDLLGWYLRKWQEQQKEE